MRLDQVKHTTPTSSRKCPSQRKHPESLEFMSLKPGSSWSLEKAVGIGDGLRDFFYWLKKFTSVVLIAYNGRRFYFPVLIGAARYCHLLHVLYSIVHGCIDSLSVFRKIFPGQPGYKQELLVKSLLQTTCKAHDAIEDVKSLSMLIRKPLQHITESEILAHSFSPIAVNNNYFFLKTTSRNIPSLVILIAKGIVKRATAENIAGSGLQLIQLFKIFKRDGEDGMPAICTQKNHDGLPRLANVKKVLDDVVPKLAEYLQNEYHVK